MSPTIPKLHDQMKLLMVIGAGSFLGGIARYLISVWMQSRFLSSFPYGTLTVNLVGCFLIGIVYALADRGNFGVEWRLFLATGILGGFTTFSSFSHETFSMLRDGQALHALAYAGTSVFAGLVATYVGITIIKLL